MKIEISHLSKNYGEKQALRDVSLVLEPGVYALLGSNGAGKSTMIGLLTDSIRRNQGEILCDGREILEMGAAYRSMLGYMPQQ